MLSDRCTWMTALGLALFGWLMSTSASMMMMEQKGMFWGHFWLRHGAYLAVAIMLAVFLQRFVALAYWQRWHRYCWLLALLCLVAVMLFGSTLNGSSRWIRLAGFTLQPSEFAKVLVVVFMVGWIEGHREALSAMDWRRLLIPALLITVLVYLLLKEPDHGSAAIVLMTAFALMFLGGGRLSWMALMLLLGSGMAALLVWQVPYVQERVTSFFDPWQDPTDSGYQLIQALVAIARGEWLGMGLGNGLQKLLYLPEPQNDFIFAVVAEEWGLVGSLGLIAAYGFLLFRLLSFSWRAQQVGLAFHSLLGFGLTVLFGLQVMVHMGVNMGLLPTKGLNLPLLSYGGSHLLAMGLLFGLLLRMQHEVLTAEAAQGDGKKTAQAAEVTCA